MVERLEPRLIKIQEEMQKRGDYGDGGSGVWVSGPLPDLSDAAQYLPRRSGPIEEKWEKKGHKKDYNDQK